MITQDALVARIKKLGPKVDFDALLAAGLSALSEADAGEAFGVKAPRKGTFFDNSVLNAALDAKLEANFGKGGEEGEKAADIALQAVVRALMAEVSDKAKSKDEARYGAGDVTLGDGTYGFVFLTPKKKGATKVRFENQSAGGEEAAEAEAAAEDA